MPDIVVMIIINGCKLLIVLRNDAESYFLTFQVLLDDPHRQNSTFEILSNVQDFVKENCNARDIWRYLTVVLTTVYRCLIGDFNSPSLSS